MMMKSILLAVLRGTSPSSPSLVSTAVQSEQEREALLLEQVRTDVDVANALVQPVVHHSNGVDVVVGVLTRRNAFGRRALIRETWAHGYTGSVFFVIGRSCPVPPDLVRCCDF